MSADGADALWMAFRPEDVRPEGRMREMLRIWTWREMALHQWQNFNDTFGYGPGESERMGHIPHNPDLPRNAFVPGLGWVCRPDGLGRHGEVVDIPTFARWTCRPLQPKPTPKQYRLKRRAAGSKRRNKGKR